MSASRKIVLRTTGHGPAEASQDVPQVRGKVSSIAVEFGTLPPHLPVGHFPTAHLTVNGVAVFSTKFGGVFVNPTNPDGTPLLVVRPPDGLDLDCSVPVVMTLQCDA